jgi:hypothetical protein
MLRHLTTRLQRTYENCRQLKPHFADYSTFSGTFGVLAMLNAYTTEDYFLLRLLSHDFGAGIQGVSEENAVGIFGVR